MTARVRQAGGVSIIVALVAAAGGAGVLAVNAPAHQFSDFVYAPPMLPHIVDHDGRVRRPFVYPLKVENRLERTFVEDRAHPMPLSLFRDGALVATDPKAGSPWFPLGTDGLGRDVLARLLAGGRLSMGVALTGVAGALLIGVVVGAVAGVTRGVIDDLLMRVSDVLIALPVIYAVLALRATAPLVLTAAQVFWIMAGVFALVGWPFAARGVRAIIAAESRLGYAEAARALGASRTRLLLRHLIPATRGFLVVQATLLLPAFIVAEATLSFAGLGFGEPAPSWGLMLQEAGRGNTMVDSPWLLAPAAAIVVLVLAVNMAAGESAPRPVPGSRSDKPFF